jgi:thymidylate synthase
MKFDNYSLQGRQIGLNNMDDLLDDLHPGDFELVGYKSYDHIAVPMLERNN